MRLPEPRPALLGPACALALLLAPVRSAAVELPHDRPWQTVLRDHLAGLGEVAFEVPVRGLVFVEETLDDDAMYRDWLLLGARGRGDSAPIGGLDDSVLSMPASEFLLSSIEAGDRVRMSPRRHRPIPLAWWSAWDHPGNPHHGSRALKFRAHAVAAVDMILLAGEEPAAGSDLLALHVLADTYAHLHSLDIIPDDVREAFGVAIDETLSRLEAEDHSVVTPSLGMATVAACAYVARAADDAGVVARAEALARHVVNQRVRSAGYVDAGGGFDPLREDVAETYLAWAAIAAPEGWDFLDDALDRIVDLRVHLLLPEPERRGCLSPDHFAPAPGVGGFPEDRRQRERFVTLAMLSDDAIPALFVHREAGFLPPGTQAMKAEIRAAFRSTSGGNRDAGPTSTAARASASSWRVEDAPLDVPPFHHDYYRRGSVDRFRRAASLPVSKVPAAREGTMIRDFDEEFLVAKVGGFAAVIHTGRIAPGRLDGGFSGGSLSAFWTPSTGASILGLRPDPASAAIDPDSWETWWRWQCHALAGTGAGGRPFSTARLPRPAFTEIASSIGLDRVTVSVAAPLHEAGAAANDAVAPGALEGTLAYSRRFDVDGGGVRVETRLVGDGRDRLGRLCEILPLTLGPSPGGTGSERSAVNIFHDTGAGWQPAVPRPVAGVHRFRVDRHDGAVAIEFERPVRAGLAPDAGSTGHNLIIELLEGEAIDAPFTSAGVAYAIRPLLLRR